MLDASVSLNENHPSRQNDGPTSMHSALSPRLKESTNAMLIHNPPTCSTPDSRRCANDEVRVQIGSSLYAVLEKFEEYKSIDNVKYTDIDYLIARDKIIKHSIPVLEGCALVVLSSLSLIVSFVRKVDDDKTTYAHLVFGAVEAMLALSLNVPSVQAYFGHLLAPPSLRGVNQRIQDASLSNQPVDMSSPPRHVIREIVYKANKVVEKSSELDKGIVSAKKYIHIQTFLTTIGLLIMLGIYLVERLTEKKSIDVKGQSKTNKIAGEISTFCTYIVPALQMTASLLMLFCLDFKWSRGSRQRAAIDAAPTASNSDNNNTSTQFNSAPPDSTNDNNTSPQPKTTIPLPASTNGCWYRLKNYFSRSKKQGAAKETTPLMSGNKGVQNSDNPDE